MLYQPSLFSRIIVGTVRAVRALIPMALRALYEGAKLTVMVAATWIKGAREAVDNLAYHLVIRAHAIGLDSRWDRVIYVLATMIAVGQLSLGWVICSLSTVFLMNWAVALAL